MYEYMVVVTSRGSGKVRRLGCHTHDEAERAFLEALRVNSGRRATVEIVRRPTTYFTDSPSGKLWAEGAPQSIDERDSRRKADPYLTFLLAWVAAFVGGVVLILTGAADAAWNALAQAFTHPVVADNAIGAALTIAGLAVIRYLRTRPREK